MDKINEHNELCTLLHEIYKSKNSAYGDSFGKSFDEWGIPAAAIRITDKYNRFVNLGKHPEIDDGDEKITDTLIDMANYCLMTVMELRRNNGND